MGRVLIVFALCLLLLAACAAEAAPTEDGSQSSDPPTSTPAPEEASPEPVSLGAAEEAVVQQLAKNLDLPEGDIRVVSSEETEFGDACLGVSIEGVMCAQVITPGRLIVLEASGIQYEYHTSEDGSRVQPASLGMVWKREGGIAGFCDILTVFRSGEVYANKCDGQAQGNMGTFASLLTSSEIQQFNEWMAEAGEGKLDASDPKGVADRMVVTLELFGSGTQELAEPQQQALFAFAQELYQELAR